MSEAINRGAIRARPQGGLVLVAVTAVAILLALAAARLAAPWAAMGGAGAIVLVALVARGSAMASDGPIGETLDQPRSAPPFESMLEHIADPVLLVSGADPGDLGDRRFTFANTAARDLLRLQRREGPLTTALRSPEVLAAVEEALFGHGRTEAAWQSRGVLDRYWRAQLCRLPQSPEWSAGPRLALLVLRDETEMKRSESTRADFLANASHELRTPLASLAGFVETLRGHAKDDESARERFLGIMQVQAERMRRLIDDLMSLSRIELGEHIRPSGRVDLAAAVRDVVDALAPLAEARAVRIAYALGAGGESAVAIADRDQFIQVAQNLIENAIKYTPQGGVVNVEIAWGLDAIAAAASSDSTAAHLPLLTPEPVPGQRFALLRVRDTGPGIARNHLPRLSERFYRVEGQKGPGTGLGLAIVKHIVNRHRGGVVVESAPGAGSTFTVYIPLADRLEAPAPRALSMAAT